MTEAPKFVPARQDFTIPSLRPPVTHDLENPEYLNAEDFIIHLTPTPNYLPTFPYHLRKFVLRRVELEEGEVATANLWHERGLYTEQRLEKLVSKIPRAQNVVTHERYDEEDLLGRDISFELDGLLIHVQVKSSRYAIQKFKHAIRDYYFPNSPNSEKLVNNWLTEKRIILVNGSETRSDEEIFSQSFFPQLERIRQKHQVPTEPITDIGQLAFSGV